MSYSFALAAQMTTTDTPEGAQERVVHTPAGILAITAMPGGGIRLAQSKDGGKTFPYAEIDDTIGTVGKIAVWWSLDTPGDTSYVLYVAVIETDADDVLITDIFGDLSDADAVVGPDIAWRFAWNTVFSGASLATTNVCLSMTMARDGTLYVAFDGDGGTEKGFYEQTSGSGVSDWGWTSRSDPTEGADLFFLAPGFAADQKDVLMLFWDRSADEISRKVYDNSGDSWAETSISTGMVDQTTLVVSNQWAFCVRHSDSKLVLVAWNSFNLTTSDFHAWEIDESAITALTDLVSNTGGTGDVCGAAITIDQSTDELTVFMFGKDDGSQAYVVGGTGGDVGVYQMTSTDAGATWSAQVEVLPTLSPLGLRGIWASKSVPDGETPQVGFSSIGSSGVGGSLFVTYEEAAGGGGGAVAYAA
ncbi:MAG TPA: hypothetical protein VFS30_00545 [Dehalococcoidia bacterium]|nr:hypothetical protein [Dehalococcoidia bacterium]